MAECAHKKEISKLQDIVEDIIIKTQANKFQLNGTKCKERRISFAKKGLHFTPIVINGKPIETVTSAKLLSLNISTDLK